MPGYPWARRALSLVRCLPPCQTGICHHQLEMHHWLHCISLPIFSLLSHEHRANHNRLKAATIARRELLKLSLRSQRHLCTRHIYSRSSLTAWTDDTMRPKRQRHNLNVILTPSLNCESVSLSGMCLFCVSINSSV